VEAGLGEKMTKNPHANGENAPVLDDVISASNQQETTLTALPPREGEETQASEGTQVGCAQECDMEPESSDKITQGTRRYQRTEDHCIARDILPDYTTIPPKVDCWRSKRKFGGENKKVLVPDDMLLTENECPPTLNMKVISKIRSDEKRQSQKEKDHGCGCFRWCKRSSRETIVVLVPENAMPTMNQQDISPAPHSQCPRIEVQELEDQVQCVQTHNVQSEPSNTVKRNIGGGRRAAVQVILHFPIPDYSKVPAKVNSWRTKPKTGEQNKDIVVHE
jgi:hypothetical protein